MATGKPGRPYLRTLWRTGIMGRCPHCGETSMFSGFWAMYDQCVNCTLRYQTGAGAWIGALALGYGIGALVALALALVEMVYRPMRDAGIEPSWTIVVIALLSTLVGYRWAKATWFALLYLFDFMAFGDDPAGPPPVGPEQVGRVREP